jgi:hypothetical protein
MVMVSGIFGNDFLVEESPIVCDARMKNGHCGHFQCEYSDETAHGQQCVNIVLYGAGNGDIDIAVCDMGEYCLKKCLFSWASSKRSTIKRKKFFVGRTQALWLVAAK